MQFEVIHEGDSVIVRENGWGVMLRICLTDRIEGGALSKELVVGMSSCLAGSFDDAESQAKAYRIARKTPPFRAGMDSADTMTGAFIYTHPRFARSTKICSGCGQLHDEIVLGVDTLACDCGLTIDRDLNAAIVIKNAASSAVSACGAFSSGDALAAA